MAIVFGDASAQNSAADSETESDETMIDIKKMTPKMAAAIEIRDAIIAAINHGGILEKVDSDNAFLHYNGGGFTILHHKAGPIVTKVTKTLVPYTLVRLRPYGLDVWPDGENKVMNIEWNDAATVPVVISFRRGLWEQKLKDFIYGKRGDAPEVNPMFASRRSRQQAPGRRPRSRF